MSLLSAGSISLDSIFKPELFIKFSQAAILCEVEQYGCMYRYTRTIAYIVVWCLGSCSYLMLMLATSVGNYLVNKPHGDMNFSNPHVIAFIRKGAKNAFCYWGLWP